MISYFDIFIKINDSNLNYRNQMENKQNLGLIFGAEKPIDTNLSNVLRMSVKPINISNLVTELDTEKEYLAKLKIQRQKTERLHSQYMKLKKQKQKIKEQNEIQITNTKEKLISCQLDLNKKTEDAKLMQKEIQRLKGDLDKISRQKNENFLSLKLNYEQSIAELKMKVQTLNQNVQAKNKQISNLKKSNQSRISQLQTEKAEIQASFKSNQLKLKLSEQKKREAESMVSILTKKNEDVNADSFKSRNQLDLKNKQISSLKSSYQRLQIDQQIMIRKQNELQIQLHRYEQKVIQIQREKEKIKEKAQQSQQKIMRYKQEVQKLKCEQINNKTTIQNLKNQNLRKQETLRQYSSRVMRRQDEQMWRQRVAQKQSQNDQLLDIIRNLKEENDSLLSFIKQKQQLERERRSLVEYQMEEISKFQNLLKDVK